MKKKFFIFFPLRRQKVNECLDSKIKEAVFIRQGTT